MKNHAPLTLMQAQAAYARFCMRHVDRAGSALHSPHLTHVVGDLWEIRVSVEAGHTQPLPEAPEGMRLTASQQGRTPRFHSMS